MTGQQKSIVFNSFFFKGISSFLSVLHKNKLTHTDLKPENILFINSDYDIEYNPDMVSVPNLSSKSLPRRILIICTSSHEQHCIVSAAETR